GAGRAQAHLAVDADDPLGPQLLGILEGGRIGVNHALRQAVMVAQVDEQHAAMVADAVAPARQPDGLANMALAERAAGMGPVTMHGVLASNLEGIGGEIAYPKRLRVYPRRTCPATECAGV